MSDDRRIRAVQTHGAQVVVRWAPGWRIPREVDGRQGVVLEPFCPGGRRRCGVKVDGIRGVWWFPVEAVGPARSQICRWATIVPGRPWERRR